MTSGKSDFAIGGTTERRLDIECADAANATGGGRFLRTAPAACDSKFKGVQFQVPFGDATERRKKSEQLASTGVIDAGNVPVSSPCFDKHLLFAVCPVLLSL